ncbi:unnamed protein product [Schistocephalus solidus]|uniref:Protein arginine N-methyltransferase 6 n=1 Tax=Schistocephalus solidus TaxID=70667 RepID=A0A183STC3_SCHSO|nr:unnamed protein product [Schistocephalus solidus]
MSGQNGAFLSLTLNLARAALFGNSFDKTQPIRIDVMAFYVSKAGSEQAPACMEQIIEIPHKKQRIDGSLTDPNYDDGEAQKLQTVSETVSKDAPFQRDLLVDEKYFKLALTQAHNRLHDQVILDVGSGTGILSIFGAKAGAKHVFAVDAAKKTCELAEKIIAENGLASSITVINSQVEDAKLAILDRVGAIVSEWMGYCLLYENMLTSVLLARDNLFAAAFTETSLELDSAPNDSAESDLEALDAMDDPQKYTRKKLWSDLSELYQAKLDGVFADCVADEFYHQVHVKVVSKAAIVSNACKLCNLDLSTLDANELTRNGVQAEGVDQQETVFRTRSQKKEAVIIMAPETMGTQHSLPGSVVCPDAGVEGHLDVSSIGLVSVNGLAIWFSVEFPDGEVLSTSPDVAYVPSKDFLFSTAYPYLYILEGRTTCN